MIGYGALVEWYCQGKTEVFGEKPVTVPLCAPRVPHGLTCDRTRSYAARGDHHKDQSVNAAIHTRLARTLWALLER